MTITIVDHELPFLSHDLYDVTFFNDEIETLVTHTPSMVGSWIANVEHINRRRLNRLVVGLDVEWRPNFIRGVQNPAATLQLCVGRCCLIFQLLYAPRMPRSLKNFLSDSDYTFVGVGICSDVEKLWDGYGLEVANAVDLGCLAARQLGMRKLHRAGLKDLARGILEKDVEKPRSVTLSNWDQAWLSKAQVAYACVDAYLSYKIGRALMAGN
ncbi:hypothetical protein L1049_008511 [Liquidambar formosana]|uniref:3'-5' exonuclease domain-containing protein n=1 Tax=Liquidambar formosana TaxID=63359 RepID=A0AAP0SAV4_LIQFO